MPSFDIAIVGAGLGGLTLGALLLQAGHKVRIYEQAPMLGEIGAGISVPPNAAKVLAQIGISDALMAASNIPERGRLQNGKTGEVIQNLPFGSAVVERFGDSYYQLHRADFVDLLVEAVRKQDADAIILDHCFESYEKTDSGVKLHFKNQESVSAPILIGADGVRSRIRDQIIGPVNPQFTGYVAWRALIPLDKLPESFKEPISNVCIEAGRNITYYPIRGTNLLNCAMFASDSEWTEEGWNIPAKVEDIRKAFEGFIPKVQTLIDAIPEDGTFQWALYDRNPTEKWSDGNVVLMGDAAHPMLPFLGQGASMAIEDASILSHALSTFDTVDEAFSNYVEIRSERSNWVLLESREAGKRFVSPVPSKETFGADGAMRMNKLFGFEPPAIQEVSRQ